MIRFLPQDELFEYKKDMTILQAMREMGFRTDAPCGGNGKCKKCLVIIDGQKALACQTFLRDGMVIDTGKYAEKAIILSEGEATEMEVNPLVCAPYHAALDIGTTTLACQILDGSTGAILASGGALNPQQTFGADVVSRIQAALQGSLDELTSLIRSALSELLAKTASQAGISLNDLGVIGVVGNPCMQQLFEGILPDNLARPPFSVKLNQAKTHPAGAFFPDLPNALLLSIPDIFGYIGGDTMGCILSSGIYEADHPTLLVDIGTNGEMVLGSKNRLVTCATAAGPALEGAGITFGMRGSEGAIDHVTLENGQITCHVIGQDSCSDRDKPAGKYPNASGICGSGLIDCVAILWNQKIINRRGRLCTAADCPAFASYLGEEHGERVFYLTDTIYLTQEDIRQVQMAKGAIAAGIELMAKELQIEIEDIRKVYLAGAFGSFIRKESACEIGLLPKELAGRVQVIGNAAIEGCRLMVCDKSLFEMTETLSRKIQSLDLASVPGFARSYAKHMGFS